MLALFIAYKVTYVTKQFNPKSKPYLTKKSAPFTRTTFDIDETIIATVSQVLLHLLCRFFSKLPYCVYKL